MSAVSLTIVILTRHRPTYLKNCLDSIFSQEGPPFEVMVIDNSDDGRTEELMRAFPQAHYTRVKYSPSVLSARNLGAHAAHGDIIAFVDDDATLSPGWLNACVNAFKDPKVGGVGGRILDKFSASQDPKREVPICKILPDGRYTGNQDCDPDHLVPADHLQGTHWAIRKEAFLQVGGFDPRWGPHDPYEEMDFQQRLRKAGWQLYFVPQMVAYHHLAPPERISRTGSNFRFRCRNTKALTHAYARSLGILPGSITFRYFWLGDTGWLALFRKPSLSMLAYVVGGYLGKCLGLLRWIVHRITPAPLAQRTLPQNAGSVAEPLAKP